LYHSHFALSVLLENISCNPFSPRQVTALIHYSAPDFFRRIRFGFRPFPFGLVEPFTVGLFEDKVDPPCGWRKFNGFIPSLPPLLTACGRFLSRFPREGRSQNKSSHVNPPLFTSNSLIVDASNPWADHAQLVTTSAFILLLLFFQDPSAL